MLYFYLEIKWLIHIMWTIWRGRRLIRVIRTVRRLGGENCKFRHNRSSITYPGMKILQREITRTQTSLSTNSGGKLSFILCFLFAWTPVLVLHIFSVLLPWQLGTIITLEPCADLIKFLNFADTTEREDRGWNRGSL
jgi:hypothetical protein